MSNNSYHWIQGFIWHMTLPGIVFSSKAILSEVYAHFLIIKKWTSKCKYSLSARSVGTGDNRLMIDR